MKEKARVQHIDEKERAKAKELLEAAERYAKSGRSSRGWDRDQLISAIDTFCAEKLDRWGDRVTVQRAPLGETLTWAFALDAMEVLRVVVSPRPQGGARLTRKSTAVARSPHPGDPTPDERAWMNLGGSIGDSLDYHIKVWFGLMPPGPEEVRGMVYWKEAAPAGEPAQEPGQGGGETIPRWLPKKDGTRARWREAYEHICERVKEQGTLYDDGESDAPEPTRADLAEHLAQEMHWRPSEKIVGRIAHAGEKGWLNP